MGSGSVVWRLLVATATTIALCGVSSALELTEVDTSRYASLGSGVMNGDPFVEYQVVELKGSRMEMRGVYCHTSLDADRLVKTEAIHALIDISLPVFGETEVSADTMSLYMQKELCNSESDDHWIDVTLTGRVFSIFRGDKELVIIEGVGLVGTKPSLLYFCKIVSRAEYTS